MLKSGEGKAKYQSRDILKTEGLKQFKREVCLVIVTSIYMLQAKK